MELLTIITICILPASLLGYCFYRRRLARAKLPPGPFCLPLLGSLPFTDLNDVVGTFCRWAEKYGPLFSCEMGPYTTIILNDPALIKEAFSKDVFVPRPKFWGVIQRSRIYNNTNGIVFSEGEEWREHRRFILQTFRDFGFGKIGMEDKIVNEACDLIEALKKFDSRPVDNKVTLSTTVANIIAGVLAGMHYDASDPEFLQFLDNVNEAFRQTAEKTIRELWPWTNCLPVFRRTKRKFFETHNGLRNFLKKICDDHLQRWTPGQDTDFLDTYVSAVKSGQYKTFATEQVPLILEDLFETGYETTTTTLRWGLLMMALNRDVQEKVQKELDEVVGPSVIPKPSDKYNLPYFEAMIQEVHRFGSIVPKGVTHCAAEDTVLAGYTIPKGAWIMPNIRFVHYNEKWWKNPNKFDPSRFLDEHGKVTSSEYLMPFSVGKRRCLGEALAKTEVFTIFAAVLQNFSLQLPDGVQSVNLRPIPGVTADTRPHQIRYIPRLKN